MTEIEQRAKKTADDSKKAIKNDWAQTKTNTEMAKNVVDEEVDKL